MSSIEDSLWVRFDHEAGELAYRTESALARLTQGRFMVAWKHLRPEIARVYVEASRELRTNRFKYDADPFCLTRDEASLSSARQVYDAQVEAIRALHDSFVDMMESE